LRRGALEERAGALAVVTTLGPGQRRGARRDQLERRHHAAIVDGHEAVGAPRTDERCFAPATSTEGEGEKADEDPRTPMKHERPHLAVLKRAGEGAERVVACALRVTMNSTRRLRASASCVSTLRCVLP